jgi:large subunit ribosomal protein L5
MSRLFEKYKTKVLPGLKTALGRENSHSIPRIVKVVVSMGLGKALADRKRIEEAADHLRTIVGQKPQITKSRRAVSGFRLRENVDVGCKVTLRGTRMYDFLDRLCTLALPRVRDFRGVRSTGFDGHGNFSMGLNEQTVFPEIDPDKVTYVQGMNIAIVTSAQSDSEALLLLREIGIPFVKDQAV